MFPKGPISNKTSLVYIMDRRRAIIQTNVGLVYRRMYVSLGLDELA